MSDDAVRAAIESGLKTFCDQRSILEPGPALLHDIEKTVMAAIFTYRAHPLAGAGEVEKHLLALVNGRRVRGHTSALRQAADLIAAQRGRIAELEVAAKPFAECKTTSTGDSDVRHWQCLVSADELSELRRVYSARDVLGREG